MNTIIRDVVDSDMPALAGIYAHSVRFGTASFELEPPSLEEFTRRRDNLVRAGFPYLAAERDGEPVGYAYASTYRPRPGYRFTVENSVYVAPGRQGLGIGKTLLSALVARCEAGGWRTIIAVIGDSANIASITLHAACGFRHAGMLPNVGWKHERWLDSVLMVREIGSDNPSPK